MRHDVEGLLHFSVRYFAGVALQFEAREHRGFDFGHHFHRGHELHFGVAGLVGAFSTSNLREARDLEAGSLRRFDVRFFNEAVHHAVVGFVAVHFRNLRGRHVTNAEPGELRLLAELFEFNSHTRFEVGGLHGKLNRLFQRIHLGLCGLSGFFGLGGFNVFSHRFQSFKKNNEPATFDGKPVVEKLSALSAVARLK